MAAVPPSAGNDPEDMPEETNGSLVAPYSTPVLESCGAGRTRQRCNATKSPHQQRTCWIVAGAPVRGSCVASAGKVGVLPTSVTFSTAPVCPDIMYDAVAATTVAPLYRCVGPHAAVGGAVQAMHDEHTSDTGVPVYAGTIPPPDGEVVFRTTCTPLLSVGNPVRLSTPPVTKPQGRPVAEENKTPLFTLLDMLLKFQSTVTPAFSSPVTDWLLATAALMPLASDAGVMPANVEIE